MAQTWLLPETQSQTGQQLRRWLTAQQLPVDPLMQVDGFDLIINLVSLGMGVSLVPIRSLALYGERRAVARLEWPARFVRELAVVSRRHRAMPEHLAAFIEKVLF